MTELDWEKSNEKSNDDEGDRLGLEIPALVGSSWVAVGTTDFECRQGFRPRKGHCGEITGWSARSTGPFRLLVLGAQLLVVLFVHCSYVRLD